ncbi:hypothetical protein BH10PSE4_BH10PSE4_35110 [soil metagenome]
MSYPTFEDAQATVRAFEALLEEHGLAIQSGTKAGAEALAMGDLLEMWRTPALRPDDPRDVVRAALGFVDLAGKVVAVRDHPDFAQLIPHLQMLSQTSVLQNAHSPITDQAGNKVIELYMACLAMYAASNVELDHPVTSSGGRNPDVMFDFRNKKWALALKTLNGKAPRTLFENIKKAADQIEASAADHGLVVINLKNVLDHVGLWPAPDESYLEADVMSLLNFQVFSIIGMLDEISAEEWSQIIGGGRKAQYPILFVGQTATSVFSTHGQGGYFTALKPMVAHPEPVPDTLGAMKLARLLSDRMQQFQ